MLIPIRSLSAFQVDGRTRWRGMVSLNGWKPRPILVVALAGGLVAVRNRCPHRDVPIDRGTLDEAAGVLECPSHGLRLALFGADLDGRPVVEKDGVFYLVAEDRPG